MARDDEHTSEVVVPTASPQSRNAAANQSRAEVRTVCGFRKLRVLGAGTFGKALLVQRRADGGKYVMKAIDVTRMSIKQRESAVNEVRLLGTLRHPFVIGFREAFVVHGFLCIITDHAELGDLSYQIKKHRENNEPYCEERVVRWVTQLTLALYHCHDLHILHRDLKSQNVFVNTSGRLRLGDFGIAKALDNTSSYAETLIGTPYYLSPEIYKHLPYSWASDVWALGCIAYELCTLRVPFGGDNIKTLTTSVVNETPVPISERYSLELRNLIDSMLSKDPSKRPTCADILASPLIQRETRKIADGVYGWRPEDGSRSERSIDRSLGCQCDGPMYGLPEEDRR